MKKVILIIAILFSVSSFSQNDFYKTPDSKLHLQYSFAISNISYLVFSEGLDLTPPEAILLSTVFDFSGTAFKEIVVDKNFSSSDMFHNAVGIILGKITMYIYQTYIKKDSKAYRYRKSQKNKKEFYSLELNNN